MYRSCVGWSQKRQFKNSPRSSADSLTLTVDSKRSPCSMSLNTSDAARRCRGETRLMCPSELSIESEPEGSSYSLLKVGVGEEPAEVYGAGKQRLARLSSLWRERGRRRTAGKREAMLSASPLRSSVYARLWPWSKGRTSCRRAGSEA